MKNGLINKARRERGITQKEEESPPSFSVLNPPALSIISKKQEKKRIPKLLVPERGELNCNYLKSCDPSLIMEEAASEIDKTQAAHKYKATNPWSQRDKLAYRRKVYLLTYEHIAIWTPREYLVFPGHYGSVNSSEFTLNRLYASDFQPLCCKKL